MKSMPIHPLRSVPVLLISLGCVPSACGAGFAESADRLAPGLALLLPMVLLGSAPLRRSLGARLRALWRRLRGGRGGAPPPASGLEPMRRAIAALPAAAPDAVIGVGADGLVRLVSAAVPRMLDCLESHLLGRPFAALLHAPSGPGGESVTTYAPVPRALRLGLPGRAEQRLARRDGSALAVEVTAVPLWEDGRVSGALAFIADLTERDQALERLSQAAAVFDNTLEGVIVSDAAGRIVTVNPAFTCITGYRLDEVAGQTPRVLRSGLHDADFYRDMWETVARAGRWRGEVYNRHKDGRVYAELLTITAVRDAGGSVLNYVGVFQDITDLKATQEKLVRLAHHDPLTGLPNRTLFDDRLAGAIKRAQREGHELAVLFLDLDRFKEVNDNLGHAIGDALLREVAQRLAGAMRDSDTLARFGGDEFVILADKLHDPDAAALVARKILAALAEPCHVEHHELVLSTSIGICLYPDNGHDAETLMRHADAAMYRAKERGRGGFEFYSDDLNDSALQRMRLQADLRHALERNQLFLEYQPVVALDGGDIRAVEALVRWRHPEFGVLGPRQFIPVAEEGREILAIGEWVLDTACRDLAALARAGYPALRVSVNLSPVQLRQRTLVEDLRRVVQQSGLEPGGLELEVTENAVMQYPDHCIRALHRLRAHGIRLSIDNFGTGASSLGFLKRLPIDRLKIDRGFLEDVPRATDNVAICTAVIALAHSLGLGVVAEGVETPAQQRFLADRGCQEAQGRLFGRPVPLAELITLLEGGSAQRDGAA